jgi:dTDP-4-amino-4,6-dideoxygalactose transaminase
MKLAVHGGTPVRTKPFPAYVTAGEEEKKAVCAVIDSGCLSKYLGCWHEQFMGGVQVRALEEEWAAHFGARHAIAVNSCTSGLYCAVGAAGVEPGDEVIVSPYTMSASATAPLVYGGIPVFADIEEDCFCLDPASIEARITSRTKAIVVVDIFGQPYDAGPINALAAKYGLTVIEDTAQAPGAKLDGRFAGTLGHMGVFSLNYHKHIHSGEGGVIVTDDDALAEKCRLIRNHAEAVVEAKGVTDLVNMVGFNYRMTEIEAAIARCQLKKLTALNEKRLENVRYFEERITSIPAIRVPKVRPGAEHVYYVHACRFDEEMAGVSRNAFIGAVRAELPHHFLREQEGVKLGAGYVRPLYLQPMFQKRVAFGSKGYPFSLGNPDYSQGQCPVCERMHFEELFTHEFVLPSMESADIEDVLLAFHKVWEQRGALSNGK